MNPRFRYLLRLLYVWLAVSAVTRLALLIPADTGADTPALIKMVTFAAGIVNDLPPFILLAAPLALLLFLLPGFERRPRARRILRAGAAVVFFLCVSAFVFGAVAEWLFWQEFFSRFNFIAVDYLIYTKEVLGNIFESYPVWPLLGAVALAGGLITVIALRPLRGCPTTRPVVGITLPCLALLTSATLAFSPLNLTHDSASRELARNGVWELFSAFRHNQLDFRRFYPTMTDADALARLRALLSEPGARFAADAPAGTLRRHIVNPGPERRLNVVQIVVESLSLRHLGPNTPHLNALLPAALTFSQMMATGTRTVRGIEALTLSIPPTPGSSIVRRPNNNDLFTVGSVFRTRGYDTSFVYGGYGYFDNMNAFFAGNGFHVVDRAVMPQDKKTFSNIWGVCDEDLFGASLREADASHAAGKPFYQFVLTTSNHRPFTYPDGRVAIPSGANRQGAVAYTDYAIGRFLREAATRPWFRDTVFVIIADHTSGSAGYTDLPPDRYRIPCIIYSPAHIAPRRVDTLCSQIDVAPTLFALLGWDYDSTFFGRNALNLPADEGRAWISTYQLLGYMTGRGLAVLAPKQPARIDGAPEPLRQELLDTVVASYQTAQDSFTQGRLKEKLARHAVSAAIPRKNSAVN